MSPSPPDLDRWLPDATVRTEHRRTAAAAPDALWRAAQEIRIADTRTLGRLVRWRIPGTPARRRYDQLFRGYPFTVLDQGERHLVSGLCGRIWTVDRDYPRLDGPEAFPPGVMIGPNTRAWRLDQVQEWLRARPTVCGRR